MEFIKYLKTTSLAELVQAQSVEENQVYEYKMKYFKYTDGRVVLLQNMIIKGQKHVDFLEEQIQTLTKMNNTSSN